MLCRVEWWRVAFCHEKYARYQQVIINTVYMCMHKIYTLYNGCVIC